MSLPTVPADVDNLTADEISAIEAFEVRRSSAFMEITFRVADSAKSVLGDTDDPKIVWELLEKRFGAKLEGLQSVIMTKLQFARWNGTGTIHTHRDNMVDLRTELADAGLKITDQTFYELFTNSLPRSLDLFISFYDGPTFNVDTLCDRFAKYEMRRKVVTIKMARSMWHRKAHLFC